MDLTSTSSLILFPMTSTHPGGGSSAGDLERNREQYYELARQASWHLPPAAVTMPQAHYQSPTPQTPQHQFQYHHPPPPSQQQHQLQQQSRLQCQLPSERMATMYSSAQVQTQASIQARRRQEREELKRIQITSFRKDGLLSPPPLPVFARRKKKSISIRDIGINGRAMESSPELASPSDDEDEESDSTCSPGTPSTPPPYSRKYAASVADLHVYTADHESFSSSSVGLGITSPGPKSAPVLRGMNNSPRRPSPFRTRTLDEAFLGASMIQPPSPSLLRPKSFWKNHPRSALTSLAYSPCSQFVRRSTFVAAGMNIDQGFWENLPTETPELEHPPRLPPKDETTSSRRSSQDSESTDSQDTDSEPDTHTQGYGTGNKEQYDPIRAFGRSLWNASTLALAVESRNRGGMGGLGGMPGVVCVPGDF